MARKIKKLKNVAKLLANDRVITAALRKGVREALRKHKRAGNPICEWRDGKIVWIPPEKIPVDE
jgi:hypothetical protein